jgi:hypothetical protein
MKGSMAKNIALDLKDKVFTTSSMGKVIMVNTKEKNLPPAELVSNFNSKRPL